VSPGPPGPTSARGPVPPAPPPPGAHATRPRAPAADLGQFERFRRVVLSDAFNALVMWEDVRVLSRLTPADDVVVRRFEVVGRDGAARTYTMRQKQRLGGHKDGYWFTQSLTVDDDGFDVRRLSV